MASQRIVLTSPWKLGLFVFLLVVGTGFGLIYAYMELFGGSFDLSDEKTLNNAYMVLGGVAGLALLGYISVITSARPLDRVVRGSRQREQLLKKFGAIQDPRNADPEDFEDIPALASVLARWTEDSLSASDAQLTADHQRNAMVALSDQARNASGDALQLHAEEETPELTALVDAINGFVRSNAQSAEPERALDNDSEDAIRTILACEDELDGFVHSISDQASKIASQGTAKSPVSGEMQDRVRGQGERLATLRQTLENLAEEANKLAIGLALQVSRLGENDSEIVQLTEDIRSLSTRYQRAASEMRLCESDQEATIRGLLGGGGDTDSASMVLDQNAEALREVMDRMRGSMNSLRALVGAPAPASYAAAPIATPEPMAFAEPLSAPEVVEDAPQARIYEIAELGGREIDIDEDAAGTIYDLEHFGAVEL